jgi:carboxypeptidase Taq
MLDEHEPGMRRARLEVLLRTTGDRLEALVPTLVERTRRHRRALAGVFADDKQAEFCRGLLADMGFDFARGRMDRSTHPFTLVAGDNDIRLTLRVAETEPLRAIFATLHEGGHALYDQGFPEHMRGTLLAEAPSMGVHESQARLWENLVGRSRAFWETYFPKLQASFPGELAGLDAGSFHRALNVVEPGTNRIAADEVTYGLHILLRYELEIGLLESRLAVADLPGAWDELSRRYFGVAPESVRTGCLQDVHWSLGEFGYFPTYAIGNWYAAQLFESFSETAAVPGAGSLGALRAWLASRVYRRGAELGAEALIEEATGAPLSTDAFFRLLERRFAELDD